jgi:hypothetical protein
VIGLYIECDDSNNELWLVTSEEVHHEFATIVSQFVSVATNQTETLLWEASVLSKTRDVATEVDRDVDWVNLIEEAIVLLQLVFNEFLVLHQVFITEIVDDKLEQVLGKA